MSDRPGIAILRSRSERSRREQHRTSQLRCLASGCACGPCRTAARFMVADAAEVPPDCPNRLALPDLRVDLPRFLRAAEAYVTPRARLHALPSLNGAGPALLERLIAGGKLVLLESRVRHEIRGVSVRVRPASGAPPVVAPPAVRSWIAVRVVEDETDRPVPRVALEITLPNGKTSSYLTRADGMVEIHEIDPGICAVTSPLENLRLTDTLDFVALGAARANPQPGAGATQDGASSGADGSPAASSQTSAPERRYAEAAVEQQPRWRIAEIEPHEVQTGESIDSLARANGLTWQELAEFNFNTRVPVEINRHLADLVGCTRKTADGYNYMFNTADRPGIFFIPKRWRQEALATEQAHTIRVRCLDFASRAYLGAQIFFHQTPIPDLEVEFFEAGPDDAPGAKIGATLLTDNDGLARVEGKVKIGSYVCRIERQPDLVISTTPEADRPAPIVLPIGRPFYEHDPQEESGRNQEEVGRPRAPEEPAG